MSSSVSLQSLRMPVSALGAANSLPFLKSYQELPEPDAARTPMEMRDRIAYGRVDGAYPYLAQDDYGRELGTTDVPVAVLENGQLRSIFLLGYGGRLWSLRHLTTGRDLLFNPGKIQLANLALRNAWFAGGVEWNIGTIGHSPTTCEPLHAAVVERNGQEVLRLYEYERLRGVIFQLDCWLTDDSPVLRIHVKISNPNVYDVPIYWWSNIAVEETLDTRVIAPADSAWYGGYEGLVEEVAVPLCRGEDMSYPGRSRDAGEYFFRITGPQRPWIATVDRSGRGLVHASTKGLSGRKMFRWGRGAGGRRWQEWLGQADRPYFEIQAGLAETQLEHLRLPAGDTWSWIEAYSPLTIDRAVAHGKWGNARAAVESSIAEILPPESLEEQLADGMRHASGRPQRRLFRGNGWGALELRRRGLVSEPAIDDEATPFSEDTLTEEQQPWLELLATGDMADAPRETPPVHHVLGGDWTDRVSRMPAGWLRSYLLASMAHGRGDTAESCRLYEESLGYKRTAWALRGMAVAHVQRGEFGPAARLYLEAHELAPSMIELTIEVASALLRADDFSNALKVLQESRVSGPRSGRVSLLELEALIGLRRLEEARSILDRGIVVPDLREGERSFEKAWGAVHDAAPIPEHYDYRMREEKGST